MFVFYYSLFILSMQVTGGVGFFLTGKSRESRENILAAVVMLPLYGRVFGWW